MQGVETTNRWSIQTTVEKLLLRFGSYYADRLYRFSRDSSGAIRLTPDSSNQLGKIVILSREHYYESVKDYPIASRAELKKALQMAQQHQPIAGMQFQQIQRLDAHNHRVNSWVVEPQSFASLNGQPLLLLPESKLLAAALPEGAYQIARPSGELFLCRSEHQAFSALPTPQLQSLETFCYMAGFPVEKAQPSIAAQQLFSQLCTGVAQSLPQALLTFLNGQTQLKQWPWKPLAALTGASLAAYFAATSAWLLYQNHQLDTQLVDNAAGVEAGLDLKRQYRDAIAQAERLAAPTSYSAAYWQVWPLLVAVQNSGSQLKRLDYQSGSLTIYGTSPQASELLNHLQQQPWVSALEIAAPIRKRRGVEHFAFRMNIQLAAEPAQAQEDTHATR